MVRQLLLLYNFMSCSLERTGKDILISAYRSFAHTWLENYRHLLRSKLPPFGYTNLTYASTSNHSMNHHHNAHNNHHGINGTPGGNGTIQGFLPSFVSSSSSTVSQNHLPGSQVAMVFAKTYELLASRDTNGPRLLTIITEELLNSINLMVRSFPIYIMLYKYCSQEYNQMRYSREGAILF